MVITGISYIFQNLMIDLNEPISVVANDAGGANQIVSFLRNNINKKTSIQPFMNGPAKKIWQLNFPEIHLANSIENAVLGTKILISGTGWQTDIEKKARKIALNLDIYSISILDNWVNYKDRFIMDGVLNLPDEIWVVDKYALREAKNTFPLFKNFFQINDYYLDDAVKRIKHLKNTNQILYILEPIRSNWGHGIEQGEFQALDYFLDSFHKIKLPLSTKIILKPHPSEDSKKYVSWVSSKDSFNINISNLPIEDLISQSSYIIGCNSLALYISIKAKKNVICSLPPWAGKSTLPVNNLRYLRDL